MISFCCIFVCKELKGLCHCLRRNKNPYHSKWSVLLACCLNFPLVRFRLQVLSVVFTLSQYHVDTSNLKFFNLLDTFILGLLRTLITQTNPILLQSWSFCMKDITPRFYQIMSMVIFVKFWQMSFSDNLLCTWLSSYLHSKLWNIVVYPY